MARKIWVAQTELYGLLKLTKITEHMQVDEQGEWVDLGRVEGTNMTKMDCIHFSKNEYLLKLQLAQINNFITNKFPSSYRRSYFL